MLFSGVLVAFTVTALFTSVLVRTARRSGWMEEPEAGLRLHTRSTPTAGGVAIATGFATAYAFLIAFDVFTPGTPALPPGVFWLGAAVMVVTGLCDDVRGVDFKHKLFVQLCVAYVLVYAGYRIDVSALPWLDVDPYREALVSIPLTLLWIVGIINAVNLIDGLDGLAAGVVLIGLVSLGIIYGLSGEVSLLILALLMAGALLGFLVHNFTPASIFMGDAGSLFLGYVVAVFSLSGRAHADPLFALLVPVVVLGLPVLDAGLAVVRRLARHRAICAPDHDHIHHRMARRYSHRRTVLSLYGASALLGASAVLMSVLAPVYGLTLLMLTTLLASCWIVRLGAARPEPAPAIPAATAQPPASPANVGHRGWSAGDGYVDDREGEIIPGSREGPHVPGAHDEVHPHDPPSVVPARN